MSYIWGETISIDGEVFAADLAEARHARRAQFDRIYAVNGLPKRYEDDLLRAVQVSDVPHVWRVQECKSESEVTPDILERARAALARDRKEMHANVVIYLGERGTSQVFLGAGAIRDKLSRDFDNPEFQVVSRVIVPLVQRDKGLGSLIMEHLIKAVLRGFFPVKPKGIHFGTESPKILHSVAKIEKEENLRFIYVGDDDLAVSDGVYVMHGYFCFMPWYQEELRSACDRLIGHADAAHIAKFKADLSRFMQEGVTAVSGENLEKLFRTIEKSAKASPQAQAALDYLAEVFTVRSKIGAHDPK